MARQYDQVRRAKLREFIFNFARKTLLMAPNLSAPIHPEFTNAYSLPIDLLRLLTLGDRILFGGNIPTALMDFSNGFLYCDDLTIQGTAGVTPAAVLGISAIYRSSLDTVFGIQVPAGQTIIVPTGTTPIPGAQYLVSSVIGAVQANGNVYQIVAGTLGGNACYFLQTVTGQNFDSSMWGAYVSGGTLTPTFIPPASLVQPQGLEISYIYDAQTVGQFDPLFIDALAAELAVKCCKQITKRDPSDKLLAILKAADDSAAAVAGQEKAPRRVQRSPIRDVRRPGGLYRDNTRIGFGFV